MGCMRTRNRTRGTYVLRAGNLSSQFIIILYIIIIISIIIVDNADNNNASRKEIIP